MAWISASNSDDGMTTSSALRCRACLFSASEAMGGEFSRRPFFQQSDFCSGASYGKGRGRNKVSPLTK